MLNKGWLADTFVFVGICGVCAGVGGQFGIPAAVCVGGVILLAMGVYGALR